MKTTFADVMREAGFQPKLLDLFYTCGLIETNIYDEEEELHQENNLKFIKPLFADNPDSFEKFFDFVSELNENPDYLSIDIQITPDHVVVFYKTTHPKVFRRTPPINPIDYAD